MLLEKKIPIFKISYQKNWFFCLNFVKHVFEFEKSFYF